MQRAEVQVSDHEQLWTAAAQLLRAQVSEAVWLSTFQDAAALAGDDSMLLIAVQSTHVQERITTRYLPLVLDALSEIGAANVELRFEVRAAGEPRYEAEPPTLPFEQNGSTSADHAAGATNGRDDGMNPRYTFETFVKGASNQFALAAALRVAETPARSYNPLFIYGSAGLGKTHLLHAIGHYVNQHYPHYTVRYVSTETFLNEYVDAIRNNTTAQFKRRYRDIDVLLIDDIQFMEGKEGLQEEFFHTFNSLHGANKQIVISSDRMPDDIPTLEERLRGRFKWGLITDIQPPDLETRLAILRNKAERDHTHIPSEMLEFIASHITTNIRELEGALIRVTAYASLNRVPVTVSIAQRQLSDLLSDTRPRAQRTRAARRDGRHPRLQRRGAAGQEPATTARHGPPDRHVRLPRPDRSQLSGHRPRVRWAGSHDGHPRRRQDPTPDEGTQADLRPGDRADPGPEGMNDHEQLGDDHVDDAVVIGGQAPLVHRWSGGSVPACVSCGRRRAGQCCSPPAAMTLIHSPQPLLPLLP